MKGFLVSITSLKYRLEGLIVGEEAVICHLQVISLLAVSSIAHKDTY